MNESPSFVRSSEANCKNCYRCIRNCPVKAIRFKGNQADVMEDCIACGLCIRECPQKAMHVPSDADRVRDMLRAGTPLVVSLAPSHVAYEHKPGWMKKKLREIGFREIRETAEAAEVVSGLYYEEFRNRGRLITTACPVVVELIERHYPELLSCLAKTDSPMIAHAKLLKAMDPSVKVVFVGPCYAKKKEAMVNPGAIDAVLTFDEIATFEAAQEQMQEPGPVPGFRMASDLSAAADDLAPSKEHEQAARLYPVENGVIETTFFDKGLPELHRAYSGIELCQSVLSRLNPEEGSFFLELNACSSGCINGPVSGDACGLLEKQARVSRYRNSPAPRRELPRLPAEALARSFADRRKGKIGHSEQAITGILEKFGKHSPEDELNCGACGYSSCREKAEAVLEGKAELYMCMPYMQAKAESLSNVIIDKTPNCILAVSEELIVQEVNEAACRFFDASMKEMLDVPIELFVNLDDVPFVKTEKTLNKVYFADRKKTAMVTVTYLPDFRFYLLVLTDLTERELEQEKLQCLKEETIEMAQKVIDNQMRVSQEIASLLGETTAVTKVTLTKMKQLISRD
ncbi:[Fe-Fe] hydrogenase large subunit C-terminal domain-containing protein [Gorillibacterium timonense]|uniref:[Fe-Fe] hydrogenase large subunit C-terminal domain-containing protein n=1 Tax=Gorillibacterium timonense TaxID=1689269 RepID=UPI00071E5922|nr:[Fe-Fe] hydrogenase large subunit C-terminal domain-containing protein [Gorillibacterium timonense]